MGLAAMRILLAVAALVFVVSAHALTQTTAPSLPADALIARQREQRLGTRRGRSLQQATGIYPSNSAPPGTATPGGLLVYTPVNCSYLDGDDFANFFADAYNNNKVAGVYLSAGNYTVNTASPYSQWVLYMGCTANIGRTARFELSFESSNLFVGDRNKAMFGFDQCANVYMHGGTLTYAASQIPFTQGTLTAVNSANWTLQVDPGYPTDALLGNGNGHLCVLYDTSGNLIQNGTDFYPGSFTGLGNGAYSLQTGFYVQTAQPGVRAVCRGDTYASHMFFLSKTKNFRLTGTSVYASNIFGIFESQCTNSSYDRVNVVPDPRGVNGIAPLFSSNADGMHSSLPYSGPQITNSYVLNPGDDAMAVQGIFLPVAQVSPNNYSIIIGSWFCNDPSCITVNPGDSLLLYSAAGANLGAATVKTVASTNNPGTINGSSNTAPAFNYDTAYYFVVTFPAPLPTLWRSSGGPDGLVTVLNHNGNTANFINNTLGNNRARGIYYRGLNGQVSGNVVQKPSAVGILMTPDLSFLEAGYNQNILVNRNYVNCSGTGIFVSSITNQQTAFPFATGHSNVTLSNNIIESSYHPVIIGSATKVNMTNNTILNGACNPWNWGDILDNQSTVPKALVYTSYIASSTFTKTTVVTTRSDCTTYGNYTSKYQKGPGVPNTNTFTS